jgi:D-alanyl-D-alanine carboxypeptidase (penicillin-binding protein 5/6)
VRRLRSLTTTGCLVATLAATVLTTAAPGASASARGASAPGEARPAAAAAAAAASAKLRVKAPYAEVADAASGAALWSRSANVQVPMGSITKVMTAYVVIEAGHLNRLITVPKGIVAYDKEYGASTAGLKPGEKLTAEQLLYAMLVPSGCDAAYTLAEAYGPGLSAFIAKMNQAAARLGLSSTYFTDFSGLPDPTEYSTYSDAQDLIALGRDAMRLPLFASIVATTSYQLDAVAGEHPAFTWGTTNPLLGNYPGTVGIKTGDTLAAGDCLLFEAVQDGESVIGVVLDDPHWSAVTRDAENLLNYGFANYPSPVAGSGPGA